PFDYQPADIFGAAHRLSPGRQKTLLRIGARPVAKAREEVGIVFCRAVQFDPIERTVLYSNPHALIRSRARGRSGSVAQRNSAQSSAAASAIGNFASASKSRQS